MEEKLSLIKLSTKSWHFKLNQYVYGSKIINTNIKNLCLYFWMLVLAIIIVPFVATIKILFLKPIIFIINKNNENFEKNVYKWINNLTPAQFADVFIFHGYDINLNEFNLTINNHPNLTKITPKKFIFLCYNKYEIFEKWINDHLKINIYTYEGIEEFNNSYQNFIYEREKSINKIYNVEYEKISLKEKKREKRKEKEEEIINILTKPFNWFFETIKKAFTFNTTTKIVKTSKHIIGAIITIGITILFFYLVQYIVYLIMIIASLNILDELLKFLLAILFVSALLLVAIYFIVCGIDNYKYNNKHYLIIDSIIWIATYLVYQPAKILIYYPLYFIIVILVWKTICISIIWNSLKSFWNGIISVSGIFGEYFGRSKGDYCPGIEWEDEKNC